MTNKEKFELCLEKARLIVAAARAEAPNGFDPQNTFAATAVVGVGLAGAGASYMANKSTNNALSKSNKQVNLKKLQASALAADQNAYALSDADYLARHPDAVAAEKTLEGMNITDLAKLGDYKDNFNYTYDGNQELTPALQSEIMRAGLGGSAGAFGDANMSPGGAGEAAVARNLGLGVLDFQKYNRSIFQQDFANNEQLKQDHLADSANVRSNMGLVDTLTPHRTFGLTGADIAGLTVGQLNTNNQFNQQMALLKGQQNQQLISGLTSTFSGGIGQAKAGGMLGGVDTSGAGTAGPNGSTYSGSTYMGGKSVPIYRPALVNS